MDDKPILDISEPKRPIILYVIIGVQFIAIIALIIVIAVHKCDNVKNVIVLKLYLIILNILFQ